ncbi:MAG TPA: hypothetical protein VM287_01120 [Egibacteraceae bacterium]|jgi:hypothetical protein|nr:hypothetical protein [Egibacteraceae bacterium]
MTDTASLRYPEAARPRVGLDTAVVLDAAVVGLADRRFMSHLDAPVQVHLLASLIAQAETWLDEQVTIARASGMSWAVIGRLLGVTAAEARRRYARVPLAR